MKALALGFDGAHSTKTLSHCLFRKVEGPHKHTSESQHSRLIAGKFEKSRFQASRCQVVAHGFAPAC